MKDLAMKGLEVYYGFHSVQDSRDQFVYGNYAI